MTIKKNVFSALLLLTFLALTIPAGADVKYKLDDEAINSVTLLVNHTHKLPYDYAPEPLVVPDVLRPDDKEGKRVLLREEAAKALENLFKDAAENGYTLYAISGYRSYYEQRRLFEEKVELVGEKQAMRTVAPQGTSEHQLGLVMDINGESTLKQGLVAGFGESPEGLWVAENAHRYGFVIRYPQDKTDITGYRWEPWHLRYVGKEASADMYTLGISLEEYTELVENATKK